MSEQIGLYTLENHKPINGFPELRWAGKRPYRSTQYFQAQPRERYGPGHKGGKHSGWFNKIFWGDNLQVISQLLKDFSGKVDLIYIDPPFDSNVEYKKKITLRGQTATDGSNVFEEKQYGDIWTNDEYLQFMYERLILMRELLAETGTIYIHCDWHRSHNLRCILDELYGYHNCHNVITWKRSHAQGNAGQGAKHFGRISDTIFVYSKTGNPIWNQQYHEYTDDALQRDYKYIDKETGERYRLAPVDGPGGESKGNPYYEFLGVTGYWRYSKETMTALFEKGEIVLSSTGKSLSRKRFLKDAKGTPVTDFWDDLNRVSPTSGERLNYPTQKPEALLKRIIKTSSNPGSIVFDCFMGSGTTQSVAMKLGRRFIGADINLGAIQTTTKRLISVAAGLKSGTMPLNADDEVKYIGFEVHNVINIETMDIMCDKSGLQLKRSAETDITIEDRKLVIHTFYPLNLMQKLSLKKELVEDWRQLTDSVMIDWNFNGAVMQPAIIDIPGKNEMVKGVYDIPHNSGIIKVKITDLLSESLEAEVRR